MPSIFFASLLALAAPASAAELPAPAVAGVPGAFRTEVMLNVRRAPTTGAGLRGRLVPGGTVVVHGVLPGKGCPDGWGRLDEGAYACMAFLEASDEAPVPAPALVAFDPPEPAEYAAYRDGGSYDQAAFDEAEALLPFVYGKRWRGWRGEVWSSAEAFAAGAEPVDQLAVASKHAFVDAVDTPRGPVLLQEDGTVVPTEQVFLYAVDRFAGRDLRADPVPAGTLPAWSVRYDGARLRTAPDRKAEIGALLPFHAALVVDATPATPDGRWWRVPDGLGPGVDAYVDDVHDIRHQVPRRAVADLAEDALWIDVDIGQQVLSLRRGEAVEWITLVSTGTSGTRGRYATPPGLYRIQDKSAWGDMRSLPGAEEHYDVEKVPWVVHFKPRFAIHGVFWHWGFGHQASHGCINMAPRDVRRLFDAIDPALPDGWHTIYATPEDPGTVLRVRSGQDAVPDHR